MLHKLAQFNMSPYEFRKYEGKDPSRELIHNEMFDSDIPDVDVDGNPLTSDQSTQEQSARDIKEIKQYSDKPPKLSPASQQHAINELVDAYQLWYSSYDMDTQPFYDIQDVRFSYRVPELHALTRQNTRDEAVQWYIDADGELVRNARRDTVRLFNIDETLDFSERVTLQDWVAVAHLALDAIMDDLGDALIIAGVISNKLAQIDKMEPKDVENFTYDQMVEWDKQLEEGKSPVIVHDDVPPSTEHVHNNFRNWYGYRALVDKLFGPEYFPKIVSALTYANDNYLINGRVDFSSMPTLDKALKKLGLEYIATGNVVVSTQYRSDMHVVVHIIHDAMEYVASDMVYHVCDTLADNNETLEDFNLEAKIATTEQTVQITDLIKELFHVTIDMSTVPAAVEEAAMDAMLGDSSSETDLSKYHQLFEIMHNNLHMPIKIHGLDKSQPPGDTAEYDTAPKSQNMENTQKIQWSPQHKLPVDIAGQQTAISLENGDQVTEIGLTELYRMIVTALRSATLGGGQSGPYLSTQAMFRLCGVALPDTELDENKYTDPMRKDVSIPRKDSAVDPVGESKDTAFDLSRTVLTPADAGGVGERGTDVAGDELYNTPRGASGPHDIRGPRDMREPISVEDVSKERLTLDEQKRKMMSNNRVAQQGISSLELTTSGKSTKQDKPVRPGPNCSEDENAVLANVEAPYASSQGPDNFRFDDGLDPNNEHNIVKGARFDIGAIYKLAVDDDVPTANAMDVVDIGDVWPDAEIVRQAKDLRSQGMDESLVFKQLVEMGVLGSLSPMSQDLDWLAQLIGIQP